MVFTHEIQVRVLAPELQTSLPGKPKARSRISNLRDMRAFGYRNSLSPSEETTSWFSPALKHKDLSRSLKGRDHYFLGGPLEN